MPTVYVLVLCDYSYSDHQTMRRISNLPYVIEVNRVDGPYDIIVKLYSDNMNAIDESIEKLVTEIHGIESAITLTAE